MSASASRSLPSPSVAGLASGAVLAALLAVLGAPLIHFAALALILVCCLPVLFGATVAAAIGPRAGRWRRVRSTLATAATAGLCFLAIQVPGFFAGKLVNDALVSDAKGWCEELATKLDRWRDEHGDYPESLDVATFVVDPPRLCRGHLLYVVRDGAYTLDFPTYETVFSAWYYRSDERSWKRYT